MSPITKQNKKQIRWANDICTNDTNAATTTVQKQALSCSERTKESLWYSTSDFKAFARYNTDLVHYAKSALPQHNCSSSFDEDSWNQLEYALNVHGHSLRGLEKVPGMPLAQKRDQKRERAIFGVMEAMNVYRGDHEQISMIAKRLSSFAVDIALEDADRDELAIICFPMDEEVQRAAEATSTSSAAGSSSSKISRDDNKVENRPAKKTRRVSKGSIKKDLMNALRNRLTVRSSQ